MFIIWHIWQRYLYRYSVSAFSCCQIFCRYQIGDWVKYKRSITEPTYGWQGATHKSVGFVQSVPNSENLIVSFCSGEAQVLAKKVLANEVIKVIPLDRGQHVKLKSDVLEPRYDFFDMDVYILAIYMPTLTLLSLCLLSLWNPASDICVIFIVNWMFSWDHEFLCIFSTLHCSVVHLLSLRHLILDWLIG